MKQVIVMAALLFIVSEAQAGPRVYTYDTMPATRYSHTPGESSLQNSTRQQNKAHDNTETKEIPGTFFSNGSNLVNGQTGEFLHKNGPNYIGSNDGTVYKQQGSGWLLNTRTGAVSPMQ